MTRRRWWLIGLGVAALCWALGGEWVSVRHGVPENHVLDAMVGLSFFGAGIVAIDRRPGNVIGPLMVAYATTWFLGNWGNLGYPLLTSIGFVGGILGTPFLVHTFLAYPSGHVRSSFERGLVWSVYVASIAIAIAIVLTWDPRDFGCAGCWSPPLANRSAFLTIQRVGDLAPIVLAPMLTAALTMRWRHASRVERRALGPLWIAGAVLLVVYLIGAFASSDPGDPSAHLLWEIPAILQIGVPIIFAWGLLSTRLARSAVGDLVVELERPLPAGGLRDALARALGDPSLEVAYAIEGGRRWVDADGRAVPVPEQGSATDVRTITFVEPDDTPLAALFHDPALDEGVVRAAGAAAGMAIANERLRAEVRAQLDEVRASRQRIVEAGDRERRRVERDLHDGAQQRLVTLSLALGILRDRVATDPDTARAVAEIAEELRLAMGELRELARGIHPAILTEDGLEAAVRSLAERSAVPVRIHADLNGRLPEAIQATAYFVLSESLTNISKYAKASRAEIELTQRERLLAVSVSDDGIGGADPSRGSGLLGLRDRVAALGGTLEVSSPPGGGTRIVVEIPCRD